LGDKPLIFEVVLSQLSSHGVEPNLIGLRLRPLLQPLR
jgi:hypothetical protein